MTPSSSFLCWASDGSKLCISALPMQPVVESFSKFKVELAAITSDALVLL